MHTFKRQLAFLELLFLGLLFFAGCKEKFPIYSTFCDQQNMSPPQCLHYAILNKQDKDILQKNFSLKEDPLCVYRVELTKYHVGSCNNPVVKSRGSDFNGYVRIEIKKGFKCYYKIQSDYKSDVNGAFERVLKKAKIDLNQ
jgi:hypothetical protein